MANIRIEGDRKTAHRLRRLDKDIHDGMGKTMRRAIYYVHSQVPEYPIFGQRTGTLGRSVTTFSGHAPGALSRVEPLSGSKVVGVVGTKVKYAPWVIDEKRQAWMHKGRWWTLQDVVRGARGGIERIFQKAVRKWTNKG